MRTLAVISIHAAQEGCDSNAYKKNHKPVISIHAAQEGCDCNVIISTKDFLPFQSTQPKRAATACDCDIATLVIISIHAAQEGCDCAKKQYRHKNADISIHAAQEGCDMAVSGRAMINLAFQSTQPKRAATKNGVQRQYVGRFQSTQPKRAATILDDGAWKKVKISIHAAQEGCDWVSQWKLLFTRRFQSTQPKRAAT